MSLMGRERRCKYGLVSTTPLCLIERIIGFVDVGCYALQRAFNRNRHGDSQFVHPNNFSLDGCAYFFGHFDTALLPATGQKYHEFFSAKTTDYDFFANRLLKSFCHTTIDCVSDKMAVRVI